MKWARYRQSFSSGYDDWVVIEIPDGTSSEELTEYLEEHNLLATYSDKYGGVEVEWVATPPRKFVEDKISDLEMNIPYLQAKLAEYRKLAEKIEEETEWGEKLL